jgi:hypothetical protein
MSGTPGSPDQDLLLSCRCYTAAYATARSLLLSISQLAGSLRSSPTALVLRMKLILPLDSRDSRPTISLLVTDTICARPKSP